MGMISLDKTYTTRQGRPVRLYAVDGEGDKPVHGAWFTHDDQWQASTWTNSGRFLPPDQSCMDLIDAEPPVNELLEALKALRDAVRTHPDFQGGRYDLLGLAVNNAIAKAEGK